MSFCNFRRGLITALQNGPHKSFGAKYRPDSYAFQPCFGKGAWKMERIPQVPEPKKQHAFDQIANGIARAAASETEPSKIGSIRPGLEKTTKPVTE